MELALYRPQTPQTASTTGEVMRGTLLLAQHASSIDPSPPPPFRQPTPAAFRRRAAALATCWLYPQPSADTIGVPTAERQLRAGASVLVHRLDGLVGRLEQRLGLGAAPLEEDVRVDGSVDEEAVELHGALLAVAADATDGLVRVRGRGRGRGRGLGLGFSVRVRVRG